MRKRYIRLPLCIILCFGLFVLSAAAEEASGEPTQEPDEIIAEPVVLEGAAVASVTPELDDAEENVVPLDGNGSSAGAITNETWTRFFDEVNDKHGTPGSLSFKSGIERCQLGGDTDLSADCNELDINSNVTLDLRGHTLTLKRIVVRANWTLTLIDSLGGGKVVLIGREGYGVALSVDGTLNANGGKIICQNDTGFWIETYGTITSDGTMPTEFQIDASQSVSNYGTISGGTFYNKLSGSGVVTGHRVTFMNGSETYAIQVVADGQTVGGLTAPSKTDHNFTGWYTDAGCTKSFEKTTPVTGSITLYAGFESTIASATVTARTLTYNTREQGLVTAEDVHAGTVMYSMDANAAYTISVPKGKNVGSYRVYWYVKANSGYTDSDIFYTDVTIQPKTVTPTVMASGIGITYTYTGRPHTPEVAVFGPSGRKIESSEYKVEYINNTNAGTATVKVTNNDDKENGNYIIQETTTTFTIEQADSSATVMGRPGLTYNGEEQTLVTPSHVQGGTVKYRLGESGAYGAAVPKAKDLGTYTVCWYVEGDSNHKDTSVKSFTVTIALPAGVGDAVEGLVPEAVTSDSRETIEDTLKEVQDYLEMDLTEDETAKLRALEEQLEQLLDKLDEVENALEDKTITDTDGINASNATASDKKKLEEAENAIEKLLEDFGANLSDAEKQELNAKLERISDAFEEIAAIEKEDAEKDKNAVSSVVKTGDEANIALWLALATLSVFAITLVVGKKKAR